MGASAHGPAPSVRREQIPLAPRIYVLESSIAHSVTDVDGGPPPVVGARVVAFFRQHPVLCLVALTPAIPEYLSGSTGVYPLVTAPLVLLALGATPPIAVLGLIAQIGLPIGLGIDGVYGLFVVLWRRYGAAPAPPKATTFPLGWAGGGGLTCIVQGISAPQSPQYQPSSATQRKAPHRSHFLGSSGSLRQTIDGPNGSRRIIRSVERGPKKWRRERGPLRNPLKE